MIRRLPDLRAVVGFTVVFWVCVIWGVMRCW
jgi:hypothetical protein